ncbi:hypothetical protein GGI42DRAFT_224474 [Trichoderma sp. SZMC 28013]
MPGHASTRTTSTTTWHATRKSCHRQIVEKLGPLHDIRHHSECSATYPNLRLLPRHVPQVANTTPYLELMIIRSLRQKRSTKLASMQLLETVLGTENFRNHISISNPTKLPGLPGLPLLALLAHSALLRRLRVGAWP